MSKRKVYKKGSILLLLIFIISTSFSDKREASSNDYFEITKNLKILASIYERVNNYYVDESLPGELMKKAIDAMLASLDPYTVYIPESNIEDFRLITTGQYGGIGASIIKQGDHVVIAEIYENSPAHQSEISVGDTLLEIDHVIITGKSIEEISRALKGASESMVTIKKQNDLITEEITVTRKKINIPSVPFYGLVEEGIGYVKLTSFTDKASQEVGQAISNLKANENINKLILDLRGNGGGLLMQAVDIVNFFIPKDQLVVETKGRMQEINRVYKTRNQPIDLNIPLVILVDSYSASASEIVSGALQDLDRAVVVGLNTFGKGLVQQTKDLKFGAKIKLTVAKYYTPSGRCIQKLDYSNKNFAGDAGIIADSLIKVHQTKNNREVKDSRGVDPDIIVEQEYYSKLAETLIYNDHIFNFVNGYIKENQEIPSVEEFAFSDEEFSLFSNYLNGKNIEYSNNIHDELLQLINTAKKEKYFEENTSLFNNLENNLKPNLKEDLQRNKQDVKRIIESEIISRVYFQKGRIEASLKDDPYVKQAEEILLDTVSYKRILNIN